MVEVVGMVFPMDLCTMVPFRRMVEVVEEGNPFYRPKDPFPRKVEEEVVVGNPFCHPMVLFPMDLYPTVLHRRRKVVDMVFPMVLLHMVVVEGNLFCQPCV